jgi:hypothetical protein
MFETMSDRNMLATSNKQLQSMMDDAKCTEAEQEKVRVRRRKLQNRISARASVSRKNKHLSEVLASNAYLHKALDDFKARYNQLESRLADVDVDFTVATKLAQQNVQYRLEVELLTTLLERTKRPRVVRSVPLSPPQSEYSVGAGPRTPPATFGAPHTPPADGTSTGQNRIRPILGDFDPRTAAVISTTMHDPTYVASPRRTTPRRGAIDFDSSFDLEDSPMFDADFHAFNHESHPFDDLVTDYSDGTLLFEMPSIAFNM